MNSNCWEKQYRELGLKAQRLYPNEELLRFLGVTVFHLNKPKRRKTRILELGCGSGSNLWMIAKEGFDAFGIDISKEGLRLCSEMLKHWGIRAKIQLGNMLYLPFEDDWFDIVIDVVSMQHVTFSEHIKAYSEVMRVLKPGGRFFSYHIGNKSFSYKNGGGKLIDRFTIDKIANRRDPFFGNEVICFPTERAIEKMLIEIGFKNIGIENVIKTYDNRKIKIQYLSIRAQKQGQIHYLEA